MATHRPKQKKAFFEKWGSFGTFQTGLSYPIEYILTTFKVSELEHLAFAQELKPSELDFELLMQRDIDIDRVNKQIVKYLSPERTEAELRTRPTFFPPLLAAVVPAKGGAMTTFLPAQKVSKDSYEGAATLSRSWGNILKIAYYQAEEASDLSYVVTDGAGIGETIDVDDFPVRIELRESSQYGGEEGIRLVVIDGQHRLAAIKKLASNSPEVVSKLVVPVCLIISPDSTLERSQSEHKDVTLPVPKVFRELFVDVNKNAMVVGGHFNSLLSDSNLGNVAVRVFCERVLQVYKKPGLAVVEWNIRSAKDATQIKRKYSLTSIGVIELALSKGLGTRARKGLLKRVLALGLIEPKLYPEDTLYDYPKPVEWDRFSPAQKLHIEAQIRTELIDNGLLRIFFEPKEMQAVLDNFNAVLGKFEQAVTSKIDDFETISAVLQHVLDYTQFSESNAAVQVQLKEFGDEVAARYDANTTSIVRYSVFQRAMIEAWLEIIDELRNRNDLSVQQITSAFVELLNYCLDRTRGIFSDRLRRYMLHSVFRAQGVIKPAESTRTALTSLIHACLANKKVVERFVKALGSAGNEQVKQELFELGFRKAVHFASHYQSQRRDDFIGSWSTDFSLPQDERDELHELAELNSAVRAKLRDKQASKQEAEEAEAKFLACVNRHVSSDVQLAVKELRDAIGIEAELALDNTADGGDEEE